MRTSSALFLASCLCVGLAGCKKPPAPQTCGGIAGELCPEGLMCVDDPNDDCDPMGGGADCIGICVPEQGQTCDFEADPDKQYIGKSPEECQLILFQCVEGTHPFTDECGCGCEVDEQAETTG